MSYRMNTSNLVWEFHTKNFCVAMHAYPEDMDPASSFEFPEDITAVRTGDVDWFRVEMAVYGPNGEELGVDHLGGCAYTSAKDFCTGENRNGYFRDMVRAAVQQAREHVADIPALRNRG